MSMFLFVSCLYVLMIVDFDMLSVLVIIWIDGMCVLGISVWFEICVCNVFMMVFMCVCDGVGGVGIGVEWFMVNNELYGWLFSIVCLNCIGL